MSHLTAAVARIQFTLLAIGLGCTVAAAEESTHRTEEFGGRDQAIGEHFVSRLDRDGDGRVSAAEYDGPPAHFLRLDGDGDGFLDSWEVPTGRPPGPRGDGLIAELDADDDGRLSMDEIAGCEPSLRRLDRDGNGFLEGDELPRGGSGGDFIQRLDRDGDDLVAPDEFDGPPGAFGHFDRDGDGFIDRSEAPSGPPPGATGKASRRPPGRNRRDRPQQRQQ